MNYPHERINVVVMFTDMAGYSALMHRDEAEAISQRQRYKQTMEQVHAKFRGEVIQYFGDGALSIFRSVSDAVDAAVAVQIAMNSDVRIPLRIGLHQGDIVRTDDDILGDGVNIASRIESFCPAGAIVFSAAVADKLTQHKSYEVLSLGNFRLKNIDQPMELFALKDDRVEVPIPGALRGKGIRVAQASAQIPNAVSNFVGREKELTELVELISTNRLVTISGPGGTGKTRLSVEVARQLAENAPTRVFWVNLAAISDPDQVAFAIAEALGVNQDPQFSMVQLLASFIAGQELIIILDNFEQVVEAADSINYLLGQCTHVKFIITSRICLKLSWELEYPVSPLSTPREGVEYSIEEAIAFPAVRLFVERAQKSRPSFYLHGDNCNAVVSICNRLDGLPLAIELAAARAKVFSPEAMLKRLRDSFDILKGGNSNLPVRHQTLRETVMWSYDMLAPHEKELFTQLSVFAGSFSMEAAELICDISHIDSSADVVDIIIDLVDKSLINTTGQDEIRFYMLETIRAFAFEVFDFNFHKVSIEKRHADFFLTLVTEARQHLTGHGQVKWLLILEAEYDNIRKALTWCHSNGHFEMAYDFGLALWRYWNNRSLLTEGLEQIQRILGLPIPPEKAELRLRMLEGLGVIYVNLNTFNTANDIFIETVRSWRGKGEKLQLANNLNHLGWTSINIGDFKSGEIYTQEALEMHRSLGNIYGEGVSINNMAWIEFEKGWALKAEELWSRSADLRMQAKDLRGYGFALANTAMAVADTGDLDRAREMIDRAIQIHEEARSNLMMYWDYMILVNIHLAGNEISECRELLDKIYAKGFNIGSYNVTVNYYMFKSQLQMIEGHHDEADKMANHGLELGSKNGIDHCVRRILVILAQNTLAGGWIDLCDKWCNAGIQRCNTSGDALRQTQLVEVMAMRYVTTSDFDKAAVLFGHCEGMRAKMGTPLLPAEKDRIQQFVIKTSEQIDPDTLKTLYSQGRNMDAQSILEFV